jgi:hypothetical protein
MRNKGAPGCSMRLYDIWLDDALLFTERTPNTSAVPQSRRVSSEEVRKVIVIVPRLSECNHGTCVSKTAMENPDGYPTSVHTLELNVDELASLYTVRDEEEGRSGSGFFGWDEEGYVETLEDVPRTCERRCREEVSQ